MDSEGKITELYERFMELERASDLSSRRLHGVRYWPLVRARVFAGLILPVMTESGDPHPDITAFARSKHPPKTFFGRWRKRINSFYDRIVYGPGSAFRSRQILFSLASRQVCVDGRNMSQMLDFFLHGLTESYAVLESRIAGAPYPAHKAWKRTFHLDGYEGRREDFSRKGIVVKKDAQSAAAELAGLFRNAFGFEIDVERLSRSISSSVLFHLFYFPQFVDWICRLRVRCLVTAVNYAVSNLVLCAAAHKAGVPVVELQHGTVYPAHPAYNLASPDDEYSPDYLFAWGPHWAEQTRNYALRKTVCTGYPMLEYMLKKHPAVPHRGRRKIVFISQGTIGTELSARAVDLARRLGHAGFDIIYKLHPNESKMWRTLYPWLADSGVEVVSNSDRSIYTLFGDAYATVGVYSTAVIEGLMWGVMSFVFADMPGGDTMRPFFAAGLLESVTSVPELESKLTGGPLRSHGAIDGSRFWTSNAAANIVAALDEIVEKGDIA